LKLIFDVLSYLKGIQDAGVFDSADGHHLKEQHREVQIKHDLMTRKCKYTLMA